MIEDHTVKIPSVPMFYSLTHSLSLTFLSRYSHSYVSGNPPAINVRPTDTQMHLVNKKLILYANRNISIYKRRMKARSSFHTQLLYRRNNLIVKIFLQNVHYRLIRVSNRSIRQYSELCQTRKARQ